MTRRHKEKDLATSTLESSVLPPDLDVAAREYFLNVTLDERIISLLDGAQRVTKLTSFEASTDQIIDPQLFPPNKTDSEGKEFTSFEYIGRNIIQRTIRPNGLIIPEPENYTFSLRATEGDFNKINFLKNPENDFHVWNHSETVSTSMHAIEIAKLALRAANYSDAALSEVGMMLKDPNAKELIPIIERVWSHLADDHNGSSEVDYLIHSQSSDPETGEPIEIRLGYKELVPESTTDVQLTLEIAKLYPELGAEDVQRLELALSNVPSQSSQNAARIIRGTTPPEIASARSIHQSIGGRRTDLDTSNPAVMEKFVDSFEDLLDKIA